MSTNENPTATSNLVAGWRAIGQSVGVKGHNLAARYSSGTLPVQPIKVGHAVAMTPAMVEQLRAAL